MQNTQKMTEFYRLSILGKEADFNYEFLLVDDNFTEIM
jgi:hypothetical protein